MAATAPATAGLPQRVRRKRGREPEAPAAPALTWPHVKQQNYEYLDHTADVQLHAWGDTLQAALEQCVLSMFGYMTELGTVEPKQQWTLTASGDDVLGLVFHLLDELLVHFATEDLIPCDVQITAMSLPPPGGPTPAPPCTVTIACRGEAFDLGKHPQGTEVKAITYSNMQVHGRLHEKGPLVRLTAEEEATAAGEVAGEGVEGVHVYVIVDI